jgi:hypothetical protein
MALAFVMPDLIRHPPFSRISDAVKKVDSGSNPG